MDKNELRQLIKAKKRQFTYQQLSELSLPIITRLLSHPRLISAQTILMYHSLPDEVNTHEAIEQLLLQGKKIILPTVTCDSNIELRILRNTKSLNRGAFNIMESTDELYTTYSEIQLSVIPGVAFDHQNHRLGRGKGYYDRMLPQLTNAYKLGVCFDFQVITTIPTDAHDIPMSEIL